MIIGVGIVDVIAAIILIGISLGSEKSNLPLFIPTLVLISGSMFILIAGKNGSVFK